jgi:mannonate dehydratase
MTIKEALILPPNRDERWDLAKQIGVDNAVINSLNIGAGQRYREYDELLRLKNVFQNAGLDLQVIEEAFLLTDNTVLGKEVCDAEIDAFCEFLRNAGAAGISTVCYD